MSLRHYILTFSRPVVQYGALFIYAILARRENYQNHNTVILAVLVQE